MYSQKILNVFLKPKNIGTVKKASASKLYEDEKSGRAIRFSIVVDENKEISNIRVKVTGDVNTIVAANILCDAVKFTNIYNIKSLDFVQYRERTFNEIDEDTLMSCYNALMLTVNDYIKKLQKLDKKSGNI